MGGSSCKPQDLKSSSPLKKSVEFEARKRQVKLLRSYIDQIKTCMLAWDDYNREESFRLISLIEKEAHNGDKEMKPISEDLIINKLYPFGWELRKRGVNENSIKYHKSLVKACHKLSKWVEER